MSEPTRPSVPSASPAVPASASPAPPLPPAATAAPQASDARLRNGLLDHVRSALISGLITLIPLFITFYLLQIIANFLTGPTSPVAGIIVYPIAKQIWGPTVPQDSAGYMVLRWSIAIVLTLATIYILGVLSIFTVGRSILASLEHFIENLPLIKGIYGTTKQVISVFRQGGGGQGFQRVVLVEFPRVGTWSVAFVTNTVVDTATDQTLVCVFIPMTPNPTSGYFQMFPTEAVRDTNWTVDQGIKILLSGGLLAPHHLDFSAPKTPGAHEPSAIE